MDVSESPPAWFPDNAGLARAGFRVRWAVGLETQPFWPYNPYVTGRLVEQGGGRVR